MVATVAEFGRLRWNIIVELGDFNDFCTVCTKTFPSILQKGCKSFLGNILKQVQLPQFKKHWTKK